MRQLVLWSVVGMHSSVGGHTPATNTSYHGTPGLGLTWAWAMVHLGLGGSY